MKRGDRVKVEFEGEVWIVSGDSVCVHSHGNGLSWWEWIGHCKVIDDPSGDLVGTVRRSPEGGIFVKREDRHWISVNGSFGGVPDASVVGWPIIGTVPGTPAWDAEQREVDQ